VKASEMNFDMQETRDSQRDGAWWDVRAGSSRAGPAWKDYAGSATVAVRSWLESFESKPYLAHLRQRQRVSDHDCTSASARGKHGRYP
jgi:hypothetical protein